jgi:hypothetical protein
MGSPVRPVGSVARRASLVAMLCLASTCLLACAGNRGSDAEDPASRIAAANQRLQGTWLLVDFQPEVPLEPMLAQLLSMQMGRLTAQLDGGRLVATGLGVHATRTYRIDDASMDRFKLTLFDESGVTYQSWGDFQGDLVRFESLTLPWRGRGSLKRVAASSGL